MNNKAPWIDEYTTVGIPHTLEPYPRKAIDHTLALAAERYPQMGLVQFGFEMPYPLALQNARRLARAFYDLGLRKGDRVVTILPTSIQFVLVDFALSIVGGIHVPCNHLESTDRLKQKCREAHPSVLLCLDEYGSVGIEIVNDLQIRHLIFTSLHDYSTRSPKKLRGDGREKWLVELIARTYLEPPSISIDPEHDVETILFTGGTTGTAKGCMLSHYNVYANVLQVSWGMGIIGRLLDGAVTMLFGVPLAHSYGHNLMHVAVFMGYKIVLIPDPRDFEAMAEAVKEFRPSMQVGVPSQYMKLSAEGGGGRGILGLSGSAALDETTRSKFEAKRGGGIIEGYGLSEMSPATHCNASLLVRLLGGMRTTGLFCRFFGSQKMQSLANGALQKLGSKNFGFAVQKILPFAMKISGKSDPTKEHDKSATIGIPMPDTRIKIVDVDTGEPIPLEEVVREGRSGELCVDGPQKMLGYWPDRGSGMDEEGFIHTGDVVVMDERGYFKVVDRVKDMVVVSGYKVYSREIDELLITHPDIEMAATVGVPDPSKPGSERVAVFVQHKAHSEARLDEEKVVGFLRNKVAKYAVPRYVRFVDTIPRTEMEKVNKKLLRAMLETELERERRISEDAKPEQRPSEARPTAARN